MLPARATVTSRGLVSRSRSSRGIALLLLSSACAADETPDDPYAGERPYLQEIAFKAACEGPIVYRQQFPQLQPPTYHPGRVSKPKLPEAARKAGHDGTAIVSVLVNEKGRVTKARLHISTGYPELDTVALEHTSKWKLRPGKVDDQVVCSWGIIAIGFESHQARTHR
jgi:TonB family protein